MSILRERRHAQTRTEIVDAAFALFDERGWSDVTMDDIATAAGVSRSTVYRRFPTKDDVVLEVPRRWLAVYDQAVAGLDPDVSLVDAFDVAARAVAGHIDADRTQVRAAYRVLAQAPALQAAAAGTTDWLTRFTELARRHGGVDDETAEIIAGACLGALDSMMNRWARAGGEGSVSASTGRLGELLAPLLRP